MHSHFGRTQAECLPAFGVWTVVSAAFVITDIWIIVLPIKTVLGLQLSRGKRATVLAAFSLGLLSVLILYPDQVITSTLTQVLWGRNRKIGLGTCKVRIKWCSNSPVTLFPLYHIKTN
jgi:hypothetical protein